MSECAGVCLFGRMSVCVCVCVCVCGCVWVYVVACVSAFVLAS